MVVAEALMADTPVGMIKGAHVGSTSYINSQTGRLLDIHHLAEGILGLVRDSATFSPRAWALPNISSRVTCSRINEILKQDALEAGEPWTLDIASFHRRPGPRVQRCRRPRAALAHLPPVGQRIRANLPRGQA